ncbi:MAG: hypothetical protein FJX52_13870 [Alphaproteobacteria bacterium]|nr:hypothetical protein [Alphaproteobacteria bacterium]
MTEDGAGATVVDVGALTTGTGAGRAAGGVVVGVVAITRGAGAVVTGRKLGELGAAAFGAAALGAAAAGREPPPDDEDFAATGVSIRVSESAVVARISSLVIGPMVGLPGIGGAVQPHDLVYDRIGGVSRSAGKLR